VKHFKYTGSWISEDGHCESDIKTKLAMGKKAFVNKKSLLTGNINLDLKKRIINSTVWIIVFKYLPSLKYNFSSK